jgi:UDP-3-O-[3-hydroxymyristoyl] glucosamine N-acyltransferase
LNKSYTAAEVAAHLGGTILGDGAVELKGFAPANTARDGDLTFAENAEFFEKARLSSASAILVDGDFQPDGKTLIRVPKARIGFAKVLALFFPDPKAPAGIHPSAVVAATAQVDPTASIGPNCVIGERVKIGAGTQLDALVSIGADTTIGADCRFFPNVTIYHGIQIGSRVRIHGNSAIGSDGFGYVLDTNFHRKIPQVGNVIIGDDAEIGSGCAIDRGALGPTVIGKGAKLDNLVQIAHNVIIGDHCIIVAQAGIAGSVKLGQYTVIAGQVGLAGHIVIGNHVTIAAQAGVMHNIADGEKWWGSPARPEKQMKRQILAMDRLPDLLKRVAKIEKSLGIYKQNTE